MQEGQGDLFPVAQRADPVAIDLADYDRYVVNMSGGKDSVACILHLLEQGVDPERIELHHHDVDGRGSRLMDWPCTPSYCTAFAKAFGLKLFFSWKEGGFEREMLRDNQRTAPIVWEREDGSLIRTGGDGGKEGTRRKFPQVTADLSRRWCSAYLKIDVGARVLTTEDRFREGKTCVVTGERAEESASRARYQVFEPDRADNRSGARVKRWIDHYRPVHGWSERQVWDILKRHRVNPHPAYWLGWGRCSCLACIFGSPNQWASVRKVAPLNFKRIADYEQDFDVTIHRTLTVGQLADKGKAYEMRPDMIQLAMSETYPEDLILVPEGTWRLPPGAFGESNGPL
jgi:3'-phosphoadenosine 5'-phosphosulfate sulfotransferase (PAPS reductase)/FAD synthetase